MSIFGQVWLWSLLAFLIGALLTWLVLVLPARKRIRELESSLATAHAEAMRSTATPTAYFTQAEAQPGQAKPAPKRELDEEFWEEPDPAVDPLAEPEPDPWEPEPAAHAETEIWQPEPGMQADPATEIWAPEQHHQPDIRAALEEQPSTEYLHLSDLEEEPEAERTSLFQRTPDPDWFDNEPMPDRAAFEEPAASGFGGADPQPEPEPESEPEWASSASHSHSLEADSLENSSFENSSFENREQGELPVHDETPAEMTQVLPKRQRGETIRGGFDAPRPIQPSMRAVERREPSSDLAGGYSGSLFEPAVQPHEPMPPASEPPPLPPSPEPMEQEPAARHQAAEMPVPLGPFGPGSAMPRPGGGRPSDEFTVKASVTALRYCTEDSAQFPRMVAEVWFRTPVEAERVGFRPLT